MIDVRGLARAIYGIHRAADVKRGRSRVRLATWEQLSPDEQAQRMSAARRLVAIYWPGAPCSVD